MRPEINAGGFLRTIMPLGVIVVLTGCAGVPADLGRAEVDAIVAERGQSVSDGSAAVLVTLTATPLTAASAVQIAMINSPRLQSTYATLGFAAADLYESGRIRNPVLSGSSLDSNVAGELDQRTYGLVVSLTDLITLPARKRLSSAAFVALKQSIAAEVLEVIADTETAYYEYVGAQQVVALREQIARAGSLSAQLAQRYRDAGNITSRELALERAAASEARLQALDAKAEAMAAKTALANLLGLSVAADWRAPAQLHLPVQKEDDLDQLLRMAQEARLDLAAAHSQAELLADQRGVVNLTRWLGDLGLGFERERETDGARLSGPTVEWELPVFNQNQDAVLRADAELQMAVAEVRRVMIDVDNSVRLAYAAMNNAKARVLEYSDVLIPQRIETVARAQEEVNFMLIGIFELISLKQDEYDTYQDYLESIRDYWVARAELSHAVGTTLPSNAHIADRQIDVEEFVRPKSGGMDHSGHSGMKMPNVPPDNTVETGSANHSGHAAEPEKMKEDHSGHDKDNKADDAHHNHDGGGKP